MSFEVGLRIGEAITNSRLIKIFKCGNMGGMRRSRATNTLVIISDHTKGLYNDRWVGDVLHYTGMGKIGNQQIDKTQNKTLNESKNNGVSVYLFEVFKPNNYIFMGQVKLYNNPYKERQIDDERKIRDVWIFPVKLIDTDINEITINKEEFENNYIRIIKQAKILTDEELADKAKENQTIESNIRYTKSKTYTRNAFVAEHAKRRAKGICQLCEQSAPFENKSGEPYLETHHIKWLSEGGADTITNTVALCPNCHRKMHTLNLKEDIKKLLEVVIIDN